MNITFCELKEGDMPIVFSYSSIAIVPTIPECAEH